MLNKYIILVSTILISGCWNSEQKPNSFTPVTVEQRTHPTSLITYDEDGSLFNLIPFEDAETQLTGYKNREGQIKIHAKFPKAMPFSRYGWAEVHFKNYEIFRINTKGDIIHQCYFFDNGADYYMSGLSRIENLRKIGFVNLKGETVIHPTYDWASPFQQNPLFSVVCQGCYEIGSVMKKGEKRCRLNSTDCYTENVGGKWGVISPTGKVVVPLEYDKVIYKDNHIIFEKGHDTYELLHDGEGQYKLEKIKK